MYRAKGLPTTTTLLYRLKRRHIWLARLGWCAVTLLSLIVFIASMQTALVTGLFARLPELAAELDVALFSIFANNQLLASNTFLFAAAVLFFACFGIGLFLFWRKSNDWLAILASAMLITIGAGMSPAAFFLPILRPQWHLPASLLQALLFSSLVLFLYLLPNGRFVPSWARPLALLWGLYALSWLIWPQLNPHRARSFGALLIFIALAWTGVVAQIYRHRQTTGIERQQQKWIMTGGFFTHLFFGLLVVSSVIGLNQRLMAVAPFPTRLLNTLFGFSVFFIPISIAIAVLRHRLWELDIWINRSLVYGGLTATILALYGLSVGLLSSLIPGESDLLISFVALIAAAVSVIPTHRVLKRFADRRFPVPIDPPDQATSQSAPDAGRPPWVWRLVHMIWLGLFAFLVWELVGILSDLQTFVVARQYDWSIQESLKALPGVSAADFTTYLLALSLGAIVVYWLSAILIFWRKRYNWLSLSVSFLLLLLPISLELGDIQSELLEALGYVAIFGLLALPFFFPDGRLVPRSRHGRTLLAGYLLLVPVVTYALLRLTSPSHLQGDLEWRSYTISLASIGLAGLFSQLLRYRRLADAHQRQQLKWVLFGGFGLVTLFLIWSSAWSSGLLGLLGLSEAVCVLVALHLSNVATVGLPVAISLSILRYRLWEVGVWINRTLVFGGLTLLVAVIFVVTVGLLSRLFQAGGSVALSVLATGLIAILFNPLRVRLQAAVNRLMYGERDDPATVLASLGKRLEETAAPAEILPNLVETIAHSLRLPYVAIAVQRATNSEIVASFPEGTGDHEAETAGGPGALPAEQVVTLPLTYQSESIGQLLVAARGPNESFNPAEMRLLRDVARQAGPAVHAYLLTADLQRSREQLVAAREEERRRLRRDLHDGLGPGLATVSVKVSAAQNLLETDPKQAARLLVEIQAESQRAVREIRRVVDGLRPSTLDQLGLLSAVREFVAQNENGQTQLAFQSPETLPPLPAAVEVAAYRIMTEAVTNVLRHAVAEICRIRLSVDSHLQLEIRDDGRGLPEPLTPGVGLSSMRERAEELGGHFSITSTQGMGTVLLVTLPLSSPA
jgi:signal transduction histidine kinase